MSADAVSRRSLAVVLLALFLGMSMSPISELYVQQAEAAEVARHTYEFSDGTTEYIALYQGGNADTGAKIALPKGAEVTDVQMTLSGASATGWSSIPTTTRDHWNAGEASSTDNQSAKLTLAMANSSREFNAHGLDEEVNPASTAWLDNGTYAVRQPHTSNSSDALFSQQLKLSPNSLNAQGQGAILRHHDWLYLSTWSSTSFHNIVHRLYPNNGTRESIITLDQNGCTLPSKHSSSYYGQWGFRDWVVTDDERLYAILSGYKYFYTSTANTLYHRIIEFDISNENEWVCTNSFQPQGNGDYTGITYDPNDDTIWVLHNQNRRIQSYTVSSTGDFERGDEYFTFQTSSSSIWQCGVSNQQARGLEMNQTHFFMRCQDGNYYNDRDQLESWGRSGSATALIPENTVRSISSLGYGLFYDGRRFITVDSGYSTWSSSPSYHEFGTSWQYKTTPAPGTTTWFGPVVETDDDVLAINMETLWSAASIGDRVDYWVSADNGTHWVAVESNTTVHFQHPGKELVWKATLIGSTAVSWWVDLEYATEYESSGTWTSPPKPTGTKVGKVRPVWTATTDAATSITVQVSNDDGSTWKSADNLVETSFSTDGAGNVLRYAVTMTSTDRFKTPMMDSLELFYEEGYPDRPRIDVGADGTFDWESVLFLNESTIQVSDASVVDEEVVNQPTLVDAFNEYVPDNGEGMVEVPLAVKAQTSGRIKITNIDIAYKMNTHAISAVFEGGMAAPDGIARNLIVKVAHGDEVNFVTEVTASLNNSRGENPTFKWQQGDVCSTLSDASGIVSFDTANCTSSIDSSDVRSIRIPVTVDWSWDDELSTEALLTVKDSLGTAVSNWETENMNLRVENDIQLDGLRVFDESGRQLFAQDWVRGGQNLSFLGKIHFEASQLSPLAGEFMLRVVGQNVDYDGNPSVDQNGTVEPPIVLVEESNPNFGSYNLTFTSPIESSPGGMIFSVEAVNLPNGSTFTNPGYNTIRLVLDGNSPLVLGVTPYDGQERHVGPPAPGGQAITINIQDSVDPPTQVTLHYWVGCKSTVAIGCHDFNFDGFPQEDEYEEKILSSPETIVGGLNIFNGLIDDSMLEHGQVVSMYVSGKDGQQNQVAMGGGPVCPPTPQVCGYAPGQTSPAWDADVSTYRIRQEFEPVVDLTNSSIVGHEDEQPLHPGVMYTAQVVLSDRNGWDDIQFVQFALGEDVNDEETSIFIQLEEDENGLPKAKLESGGEYIAVSNLYSQVSTFGDDENQLIIRARFQLTWSFPEIYDTDGAEYFIPVLKVTDKPCNEGETIPCFSKISGLGSNAWSLDNDFRFYTEQGHIKAVELRDGTNHYNDEADETLIGSGQALRVTGRVLFSEDETPAPAGAFDVVFGDFDHVWRTSPRENGEFSLDLLVPAVNSGHLDFRLRLDDLPGLAQDQTNPLPRVRFAVDSSNPTIQTVMLNQVPAGSSLSIGEANSLLVMLETVDDNGFDLDNPAVLHYRIRAGEAEISRGATALPETLPFGDKFFWTGTIDLTDMGATTLLPSYVVDIWVSGSDATGNPFETVNNNINQPFATWPLSLLGPSISFDHSETDITWSNPSPTQNEASELEIRVQNEGGKGNVSFVLQRLVDGGNWNEEANTSLSVVAGIPAEAKIPVVAVVEPGESQTYRLLVLVDGVEMDRYNVDPLIVKKETIRDGDALAQQAGEGQFTIFLYLVTVVSLSAFLWMLVMYRRMKYGEEDEFEADQTDAVAEEMEVKTVPELNLDTAAPLPQAVPAPAMEPVQPVQSAQPTPASPDPRGIAPLPPTGLPEGWTQEQWNHFGWMYIDGFSKK